MSLFAFDKEFHTQICGIDEVGRGPLAGPVVAAAVILPEDFHSDEIDDSKALSPKTRERLYGMITTYGQVGVGQASVEEIDRLNILQATFLAMYRAYEQIPNHVRRGAVLVDGNRLPPFLKNHENTHLLIGGDGRSACIAAASIVAKVTRDRQMRQLATEYPLYGWHKNAGYGTRAHREALLKHGPTPHHRTSFAPVRLAMQREITSTA